jgi:hypothetical protein
MNPKLEALAEAFVDTISENHYENTAPEKLLMDAFKAGYTARGDADDVRGLVEALEYYKQFSHLPEHIQLKERIGGGRAAEALAAFSRAQGEK